jgi:hypothetical protein
VAGGIRSRRAAEEFEKYYSMTPAAPSPGPDPDPEALQMALDFVARAAEAEVRERLDSLENDVRRCYFDIPGGPAAAHFPAVMYAMATLDFLSSCYAGWNSTYRHSKRQRGRDPTKRMVDFLARFTRYERRLCLLAVDIWRHKLMHTGQPRMITADWQPALIGRRIDPAADAGFKLTKDDEGLIRVVEINPIRFAGDLREAALGESGYVAELCRSSDLMSKFTDFHSEVNNYTLSE